MCPIPISFRDTAISLYSTLYTSAVQRSYVLGRNSLMPMEVRAPPHYCYYYLILLFLLLLNTTPSTTSTNNNNNKNNNNNNTCGCLRG
jgi:hypothetical protein